MRLMVHGFLSVLALSLASPASAQILINEVMPNPGSQFDGAEFIELYNPTGGAVNIAGWVIAGPEFDGTCGGEDFWEFPVGASIPAGGYVVIAKDNIDAPDDEQDGFLQRYGVDASFEMYDGDQFFEFDDPSVPNMILVSPNSGFDDQIQLIPSRYGASCAGTFNQFEALYLYDGYPSGTLIDAIEYKNPDTCTTDVCTDIGGLNDAFVGIPFVGESVGRDASGTDTGSSLADLFFGTPTPFAANIANPGPLLSNLAVDNPDPLAGETVTVSIDATDANGIGSVWVVFRPGTGAPDSVMMTNTVGDTYTGTVPAQPADSSYAYFVRAYDGGTGAGVGFSKFPDFGTRGLRWGTQDIFDVQFHTPPSDTGFSAELGNAVNIEGIVTTEQGLYNAGTFVISSAPGFWNSVHCFDALAETVVQRGDLVRVSGVVEEFFNLTEVVFFGATNVTILSSGNPLPGPQTITASQIATGAITGETLEGVYSRLENVEVTLDDDGFGQFEVTDASGTALVGDDAFYLYNATLGDSLDAVEGVVGFSFSERKLEPRDTNDIIGPPIVSNIRYNPTPPLAAPSTLRVTATITDNGSITRAKLIYVNDPTGAAVVDSVDMVNTIGDEWEGTLDTVTGPEIDYHIEVTDDTGFNARGPFIGEFDLYRGLVPIQSVQFTTNPSGASPVAGSPRNVGGIVTIEPGIYGDNIFNIQNDTLEPEWDGIEVFTGGSVVGLISRGDSVSVSGDVVEFNGKTQIDLHFTTAFTNHGSFGTIQGYELTTDILPPDSTGVPIPTSEPWESVLVQMSGAVVTNANAGFGQYYIDNTDPRSGQETLVDDDARPPFGELTYQPTLGDSITVRGIVDFAFGDFKIQPRDNADILPYVPADAVDANVFGAELAFALHQNSPNPFTGQNTRISFAVPSTGRAKLRVFDVQGRLVKTLVSGPVEAGFHTVDWNGRNDDNRKVTAGVYFYRLEAAGESSTRKLILLR